MDSTKNFQKFEPNLIKIGQAVQLQQLVKVGHFCVQRSMTIHDEIDHFEGHGLWPLQKG